MGEGEESHHGDVKSQHSKHDAPHRPQKPQQHGTSSPRRRSSLSGDKLDAGLFVTDAVPSSRRGGHIIGRFKIMSTFVYGIVLPQAPCQINSFLLTRIPILILTSSVVRLKLLSFNYRLFERHVVNYCHCRNQSQSCQRTLQVLVLRSASKSSPCIRRGPLNRKTTPSDM